MCVCMCVSARARVCLCVSLSDARAWASWIMVLFTCRTRNFPSFSSFYLHHQLSKGILPSSLLFAPRSCELWRGLFKWGLSLELCGLGNPFPASVLWATRTAVALPCWSGLCRPWRWLSACVGGPHRARLCGVGGSPGPALSLAVFSSYQPYVQMLASCLQVCSGCGLVQNFEFLRLCFLSFGRNCRSR